MNVDQNNALGALWQEFTRNVPQFGFNVPFRLKNLTSLKKGSRPFFLGDNSI